MIEGKNRIFTVSIICGKCRSTNELECFKPIIGKNKSNLFCTLCGNKKPIIVLDESNKIKIRTGKEYVYLDEMLKNTPISTSLTKTGSLGYYLDENEKIVVKIESKSRQVLPPIWQIDLEDCVPQAFNSNTEVQ